jgi:hypothetical protein
VSVNAAPRDRRLGLAGPVIEDLALQRKVLQRDVAVRHRRYQAAGQIVADSDLIARAPVAFRRMVCTNLTTSGDADAARRRYHIKVFAAQ